MPGVTGDQLYTGSLANTGETLSLRDEMAVLSDQVPYSNGWFSGHAEARVPMVRCLGCAGSRQSIFRR